MKLYIPLLAVALFACHKPGPKYKEYGCLYGTSKTTGHYQFIGCWHREIALCGANQTAADNISDKLGIPRVDVTVVNNYTGISYTKNEDCACQ